MTLRNAWHALVFYGLGGLIGGLCHAAGIIGSEKPDPDSEMERARWFFFVFLFVFVVLGTGLYISRFASEIYPNVPEQFGGGRPRTVRFLFDKDVDGLKALGLKFCNDGQLSDSVKVLYEGESTFVVQPLRAPVLQIDKGAIRAVAVTTDGCP